MYHAGFKMNSRLTVINVEVHPCGVLSALSKTQNKPTFKSIFFVRLYSLNCRLFVSTRPNFFQMKNILMWFLLCVFGFSSKNHVIFTCFYIVCGHYIIDV